MGGFVLRVKFKTGQKIVDGLTPQDSVIKLKEKLSEATGVNEKELYVLVGFPPKPLNLNNGTIQDSNIISGETLIVEEKRNTSDSEQITIMQRSHISDDAQNEDIPGILMKMVVPADDSCLFTSIGFVLGGKVDPTCSQYMREIIANSVSSSPEEYSEAMLGKPNKEYCQWILKSDSWGGAIELAILSSFYGLEIAVVDSSNGIINRFGEDKHFPSRVFLIFDGIHYDPLYLEPMDGGSIQTIFQTTDDKVLQQAHNLAQEAKSSHQYTNIQKFTLKCLVCNVQLTGSESARIHAKETGHQSFGEIVG